jgi:hypothetical protein
MRRRCCGDALAGSRTRPGCERLAESPGAANENLTTIRACFRTRRASHAAHMSSAASGPRPPVGAPAADVGNWDDLAVFTPRSRPPDIRHRAGGVRTLHPPPTLAPAVLFRMATLPLTRGSLQTTLRCLHRGEPRPTHCGKETNRNYGFIFNHTHYGVTPSLHPA